MEMEAALTGENLWHQASQQCSKQLQQQRMKRPLSLRGRAEVNTATVDLHSGCEEGVVMMEGVGGGCCVQGAEAAE